MPKVRVLLDVDGCINAVPADWSMLLHLWGDVTEAKGVLATERFHGFTITFTPQWGQFITELIEMGADVQWLTTWGPQANVHICPMQGIPELPILAEQPFSEGDGWWKLDAVKEFWKTDPVPFVWIDDDLNARMLDGSQGAFQWVEENNVEALLICPDTRLGLRLADMNRIREWIDNKLVGSDDSV